MLRHILLVLPALATATVHGQVTDWEPFEHYPLASYQSSPASQTVTNFQLLFNQTAIMTDKDTFRRFVSGVPQTQIFPTNFSQIDCEIESGTVANTNISFNGETGAKTYIFSIQPHDDVEQITLFYDTFYYVDAAPVALIRDPNYSGKSTSSTNVVQYNPQP